MAKRTWFSARKRGDKAADIAIYDEVGAYGVSAAAFRDELQALGDVDHIELRINSPGGDVFAGLAIHNMLDRHPADITVTVDGIAASIASLIAMAGDRILMPENATMMIHDPSGVVIGTADDMRDLADAMDKIASGMAHTYATRSGLAEDEVRDIMADETWLEAEEAVELGFADEVTPKVRVAARFDLSKFAHPPAAAAKRRQPKEIPEMTDAEKAEAERKQAEATEAKRQADITALCDLAGKPERAAEFITAKKTTDEVMAALKAPPPAQTEVDAAAIEARLRKEIADITAACELAGQPDKAAGYIAAKKTLTEVMADLRANPRRRDAATGRELNAHHTPGVNAEAATSETMMASMKRLVKQTFPGHAV